MVKWDSSQNDFKIRIVQPNLKFTGPIDANSFKRISAYNLNTMLTQFRSSSTCFIESG